MSRQIKVSDTTHERLNIIKGVNKMGSFDATIFWMMQGCVDELDVIKRVQTAVTLIYDGYGNVDESKKKYEVFQTNTRDISFNELKKSDVGDMFQPELDNHMYYSYDIAQVVYTEKDFVVLKITTYTELPWIYEEMDINLIGVHLL